MPSLSQRLVLGKCTIDLLKSDPAPFSAVELEAQLYLGWDAKIRKRFRAFLDHHRLGVFVRMSLRPVREQEEIQDQITTLCEELGAALLCLIFHAGRKRMDAPPSHRSIQVLSAQALELGKPLFFEWGKEDTLLTTQELRGRYPHLGSIIDPDRHGRFISKVEGPVHFKLHGWHPERWMRRYGETLGRKLSKRVLSRSDAILILAHSGRIDEAHDFERWMQE